MIRKSNGIAVSGENTRQALTISLISQLRSIENLPNFLQDQNFPKITNTIFSLFKRKLMTKMEEQGYTVSNQKGSIEITVEGSGQTDVMGIIADCITNIVIQVREKKQDIKCLAIYCTGNQLKQEMSKLLDVDLQEENVNSSPTSRQPAASPRSNMEKVEINGIVTGNSQWFA